MGLYSHPKPPSFINQPYKCPKEVWYQLFPADMQQKSGCGSKFTFLIKSLFPHLLPSMQVDQIKTRWVLKKSVLWSADAISRKLNWKPRNDGDSSNTEL